MKQQRPRGLCPARADRCAYRSCEDKKTKGHHRAHTVSSGEEIRTFENSDYSIDKKDYDKTIDEFIDQLLSCEGDQRLGLWILQPEKRDVWFTYTWSTFNFESDVDTIMPVAGSPSRSKTVNGNLRMHVDDLLFTSAKNLLLLGLLCQLLKTFQTGSLDTNDVIFCGQRTIKQGSTVVVRQDLCIDDLHEPLTPNGKDTDSLVGPDLVEYRSVLGKLNWLQSRMQFHISYYSQSVR